MNTAIIIVLAILYYALCWVANDYVFEFVPWTGNNITYLVYCFILCILADAVIFQIIYRFYLWGTQ